MGGQVERDRAGTTLALFQLAALRALSSVASCKLSFYSLLPTHTVADFLYLFCTPTAPLKRHQLVSHARSPAMSSSSVVDSQRTTRPAEEEAEGAPFPKSPRLTNGPAQQKQDADATELCSISATTTHIREGVTYRSVGVSARNSVEPEEGKVEMKEPEKELKDPWKTLPRDVVEKVLEWTLEVQMKTAEHSYAEEDIRKTGWSKDRDTTVG
jgi:hypothetical protein